MQYYISDKLAVMKPSAIREIFKSTSQPGMISFAAGNPSPLSFPIEAIAKIAADIFADEPTIALQYSVTEGYPPFRTQLTERLKTKFDISADGNTTIVVTGGQQGIELACKALCNEGDTVICEEPTFIGALNAFRSNGAVTVGIPLDGDGIDPDALDRMLTATPRARLIYLIPTFQNPSGITTSLEKRKKIYEIAVKHSVIILEDNPYGELRFSGAEIPTIKSMDTENIVIYCSSFSKIMSSGMRIGYIHGPSEIVQKMVVAKQVEDVHTNIFFQMLCSRFISEYDLDAHIAGIRKLYHDKCALMLGCLDEKMPKEVKYTRPEGGLFIWCTLPDRIDMKQFVKRAIEKKVAVVPGTAFCCDPDGTSQSFRMNYSTPSDDDIRCGVAILADVASEML